MPIHRTLNQDFFKKWSDDMAYVLGFFAADGTMIRNNRGGHYIEFNVTDREILEHIKRVIGSNHKIKARKRKNDRWKTCYRIQIGSKAFFEDLRGLGFTQNKSNTLCLPKIPCVHVGSFVRGYFDGDGCVYFAQHKAKDRTNPRWVFQTRFTSGSKSFLNDLHALIKKNGVAGGFITKKNRGFELVLSHRDGVALCRLMYNNAPRIYLKRKYKIFQKVFKTLYGEQMRP